LTVSLGLRWCERSLENTRDRSAQTANLGSRQLSEAYWSFLRRAGRAWSEYRPLYARH
jgi:hypothetical protein